ncbi:hypothetical protein ACVS9P_04470 [Caproicibacterium sp. NSD3]
MKTAKLTIGIISIVLSLVIFFQSCAAGVGSALATGGTDTSGGNGMLLGILLIVAGIVTIAAKNSKGGAVASTILYAIGGIVALAGAAGMYKDLTIWGVLSLIFAVVCAVSIVKQDFGNNGNYTPSH